MPVFIISLSVTAQARFAAAFIRTIMLFSGFVSAKNNVSSDEEVRAAGGQEHDFRMSAINNKHRPA